MRHLRLRDQFETQALALRNMLNNLLEKIASLRRTRDLLLPRLVSGEVNVADVEIALE